MKMKYITIALVLTVLFNLNSRSLALEFVGGGGIAMENRVGQCVITINTKQTKIYLENGWVPTGSGKCGKEVTKGSICGQGGAVMINIYNFCIQVLDSCLTSKLLEQGWHAKRQNETCIDQR